MLVAESLKELIKDFVNLVCVVLTSVSVRWTDRQTETDIHLSHR